MNKILCGLPMCGKTTVGKLLADRLGWNFIDTDKQIEKVFQIAKGEVCSCRQIVLQEGEPYFRELEKQQIAALSHAAKSIIAVGGGSLNDVENVARLQKLGDLIYLKTDLTLLWERTSLCGVPAYLDRNHSERAFFEAMEKRMLIFEAAVDYVIDTNQLSVEEVVAKCQSL